MSAAEILPVSLLKTADETAGVGEVASVGERLSRGFQELLSAATGQPLAAKPGSVNLASYTEWRIAQNPHGVLLRYALTPKNDQMLVHLPGALLTQMVDLAFGGGGNVSARSAFTPAEMRFATRLAEGLVPAIREAWDGSLSVAPKLINVETDLLNAAWPKTHDQIVLQSFLVESQAIKPATISWTIASDTFKAMPTTQSDSVTSLPDPVWCNRMKSSAMAIRLPARSILTRCELPLTQLLHLAPGDVIPIFLPASVPLTVAGRIFAHGNIGEANGRAALRIEAIEKGNYL